MSTSSTTNPTTAGFSYSKLQRITTWINNLVHNEQIPYAAALISRNKQIIYVNNPQEITTQQMRIFALSGPIISVCLMTFWEDGMFHLDDPVKRYLKEFRNVGILEETVPVQDLINNSSASSPPPPPPTRPTESFITIRQLLTHTAGLSHGYDVEGKIIPLDYLYEINGLNDTSIKLDRFIQKLGRMPLLYEPGHEWHYSVSLDVIARLCEVFHGDGMSIDDILQERIFKPLQMLNTLVWRESTSTSTRSQHTHKNIAPIYMPASSRASMMYPQHRKSKHLSGLVTVNSPMLRECTPIVSTTSDFHRFLDCLLHNGLSSYTNKRILSPRTCEIMMSNQLPPRCDLYTLARVKFSETPLKNIGFSLGLGALYLRDGVDACSADTLSWGGSGGSFFFLDKKLGIIGCFFTQCLFIDIQQLNLRAGFIQRVYSSLEDDSSMSSSSGSNNDRLYKISRM
jgi:CubicO group peptidase (beta-lactamase class C family)